MTLNTCCSVLKSDSLAVSFSKTALQSSSSFLVDEGTLGYAIAWLESQVIYVSELDFQSGPGFDHNITWLPLPVEHPWGTGG